MKTKLLSLVGMFLLGAMTAFAQNKTEEFKVNGKCEMCQNRIQTAALSVDGVKTANWDVDSKMLKVTFDKKVDIHKVHKAIADVGHDTKMHKATDETYANLPGCCKYDRDAMGKHEKEDGHKH